MQNPTTRPKRWRSLNRFNGTYASRRLQQQSQQRLQRKRYPKPASLESVIQPDGVVKLPMGAAIWSPGTRVFFKLLPRNELQISTRPTGSFFNRRLQSSRIRRVWPNRARKDRTVGELGSVVKFTHEP